MAFKFPDGASFAFSTTFAAAKTAATYSNANPGVAGSVAHGYTTNDELLLTSGWEDATDSIYRATSITADTLSLQGLDTSSTTFFPAGAGAGSTFQKVSSWQTIPQVLTVAVSGGDARTVTISPLARRTPIIVPIGLNPSTITLTIGHDASNAVYQTMLGITRALTKVAFKQVMPDGSVTYGYGNMVVSSLPNMQNGRENQATVTLSLLGRTNEYA